MLQKLFYSVSALALIAILAVVFAGGLWDCGPLWALAFIPASNMALISLRRPTDDPRFQGRAHWYRRRLKN